MFQLIASIITEFRKVFKREKTWRWFAVLIFGFMVRSDYRGVTSVISELRLHPRFYHTLLHFFRSNAYDVKDLYNCWVRLLLKNIDIVRSSGRAVVIGDHIKISKEGLRMPEIHTLHQDSDNSGKAEFIEGHIFGQVSAIITNGAVCRSVPLITETHEPKTIDGGDSLVVKMINQTHKAAQALGEPVYAVLDAYFSSGAAWDAADQTIGEDGVKQVEIVTRAKKNTIAFNLPEPPQPSKRGRKRKYGEKINLRRRFSDPSGFIETEMLLYGKNVKVRYLSLDLLWKPVKKQVRFVLTETPRGRCVLMSSDLGLAPEEIIRLYSLRFKIETGFGEQKNGMGSFAYRFWTTALPKRKKWKNPLDLSIDPKSQKLIAKTKQAVESFVCLNNIAAGIMTIIAFSHSRIIWDRYPGWLRTVCSYIPSIAVVKAVLRQDLPDFFASSECPRDFSFISALLRRVDFFYKSA